MVIAAGAQIACPRAGDLAPHVIHHNVALLGHEVLRARVRPPGR
jgi:hypothetical protein